MVLDLIEARKILVGIDISDDELTALISNLEEIAFGVVNNLFEEACKNEPTN